MQRLKLRFGLRAMLFVVMLVALFFAGWTARDGILGRSFRPYTFQRQYTVSAKNNESSVVSTGVFVRPGDLVVFNPKKKDRWSAHGPTGPFADYSGSPGYPARLRLHFRVGDQTGFVSDGTPCEVRSFGVLELFCCDDDVQDNHGNIRVDVKLSSSTRPIMAKAPKTATNSTQPVQPPSSGWAAD